MVSFTVSIWPDIISLIIVGSMFLYYWIQRRYSYWKNKGVKGLEPKFLVGNLGAWVTGQCSIGEVFSNIYNETKHLPYSGGYMLMKPCLIINDLELIKRVLVKDFAHFTDHGHDCNYKVDPLFENLFVIKGERWKRLRAKLTPTFTSSRMKEMFGILESCSSIMMQSLEANQEVEVDVKELLCKYLTDVIGSCAFGIDCNSFKNPDAEFRKYGKKIVHLPLHRAIVQTFFLFLSTERLKNLPFSILGNESNSFFINTVKNTIEYREKHKIVKNDALQLLIQLMKQNEISGDAGEKSYEHQDDGSRLSLEQVAAQAFVFFYAGFDTSSTTGSFAILELAKNPDVQKNLLREVDDVLDKHDGKLTYDSISDMPYLTMVIEETMRKYPVFQALFRICTKDYTIPDTNIVIEKDTSLLIPLYAIQRDARYYPDPEKFDPERFTPENKASRNQFSYMPFGEGPRICIGSRFGMMQTKLGIAALVSKYEVSMCGRSPSPVVFDKTTLLLNSKGPVYVKLTKRIK